MIKDEDFEWDEEKDRINREKHGVSFGEGAVVFADPYRIIVPDTAHSTGEERWYCFGRMDKKILTVRFTKRGNKIRIFGAAEWRKGRKAYEKKNPQTR